MDVSRLKRRVVASYSTRGLPGWSGQQLLELGSRLETIVANFQKLTKSWSGIRFAFSGKAPPQRIGWVSLRSSDFKITAYLGTDPEKALAEIPLALARRLMLLDGEKGSSIDVYSAVKLDDINKQKNKILGCLGCRGNDTGAEKKIEATIDALIERGWRRSINLRITLSLFNGIELPVDTLCSQIATEMNQFRQAITPLEIRLKDIKRIKVVEKLAHFALLSLFADRLGRGDVGAGGRQIFSGTSAKNVALIVFGLMSRAREFEPVRYPAIARIHMDATPDGYETQFVAFYKIFNAFYENITIKNG